MSKYSTVGQYLTGMGYCCYIFGRDAGIAVYVKEHKGNDVLAYAG